MQDNDGKLQDALAKVSRLREQLTELEDRITREDDESDTAALGNPQGAGVRVMAAAKMRGWLESPATRAVERLFRENKETRNILKRACQMRLQVEESACDEIEQTVRADLGTEFDNEQIERHPRLARARQSVQKWRAMVRQTETEQDQQALWTRCMRNFF
jgi:hypothetical protein